MIRGETSRRDGLGDAALDVMLRRKVRRREPGDRRLSFGRSGAGDEHQRRSGRRGPNPNPHAAMLCRGQTPAQLIDGVRPPYGPLRGSDPMNDATQGCDSCVQLFIADVRSRAQPQNIAARVSKN